MRYIFFIVFLCSNSLFAGTAQVQVDHQDGELGEQFNLSVTIAGDLSGKVELPPIQDLLVSGTGTSTNISWINGNLSKQTSYNFVLEPQKEGTFTIPSLKLKIDDQWVNTDPVTIMVRSGGGNAPSAPQGSNPQRKNKQVPDDEPTDQAQQAGPNVFIEREFSKTNPYEGEPVVVTTKIFHRIQLANAEVSSEKPAGVRIVDIKKVDAQEQRGNFLYNVIVVKQTFVPLRSGKLTIPPFKIKASLVVPSQQQRQHRGNDPFDDFFDNFFSRSRGRVVQRVISSKEVELNIKPVPTQGRPSTFKDLVGIYRIGSELSLSELKAGDTATLTVTVDGVGALDSMGNLDLNLGPNFRVYPDKPQVQEKASERHGLESKRTFRFAIVPLRKGDFKLGELKIPYFDYGAEKFQELVTDLGALKVSEGDVSNSVTSTATSDTNISARKDVKSLANDLLDIHRDVSLQTTQSLGKRDYLFALALVGVPGLLCLLLMLLRVVQSRSKSGLRRREALKNFEKRIAKDNGDAEACYNAFRSYIGDRFELHGTALTAREISSELRRLKVPESILSELEILAGRMEQSQYARESLSSDEVDSLLKTMKRLAREIEKQC